MTAYVDGELEDWERRSLAGDFSQMPRPFRWRQSGRFAHLLNGYKEAGGFDELASLHHRIARDVMDGRAPWRGSARDLWLCLFFEHRAARHTGSDGDEGVHDDLCEELRKSLQALDQREAPELASRLESA